MKENDFKHELHAHKRAYHFDLSGDLFFCLVRAYQDFKKIYPFGDALNYYCVAFQMSPNQKICTITFHLHTQIADVFQPEISLHYDIAQQERRSEPQLECLYQEAFSRQHIAQIEGLNQFTITATLFKYIEQAKNLFVQWNESYYSLQFNQFRLTMFEQSSFEYAETLIVLTQPEPMLLEPHYHQDNEEPPLTAYILFNLNTPAFVFQHFIKNKTEDIIHKLSLQPKGRIKRQNEKLRQQAKLEDEK